MTPPTEYSELWLATIIMSALVSPPAVGGEGSTDIFNIQYSLSLHIHLHFTLNICQTHALEINASHHQQIGMRRSGSSAFLDYTRVRDLMTFTACPLRLWIRADHPHLHLSSDWSDSLNTFLLLADDLMTPVTRVTSG